MKLHAERNDFVDAIAWATRTVGTRTHLPALAGVLVEAADGRLTCRATDLETSAEVSVVVKVDQPGRALLPGRLLAGIVARLPDAPVELEGDSDRVTIRCGRATYQVRGMAVADFPAVDQPDTGAPRGVLKAEQFVRLVGQVARAASTDDARPVLTGVQLQADRQTLVAAATDSYRLAVRRLAWDQALEAAALVPARALTEAAKAAGETGGDVTVTFEESRVTFVFGDRRLTTNLVEGNFPDYTQLLPDDHGTRVVVDRLELAEALQRVAVLVLGQPNTPVKLTFAAGRDTDGTRTPEGSVDLAVENQELGEAQESLPVHIDGDDIPIAFNPVFLLTGLEAVTTEQVVIELRDGLKPAVVRPHAEGDGQVDDFLYLIMPVRV